MRKSIVAVVVLSAVSSIAHANMSDVKLIEGELSAISHGDASVFSDAQATWSHLSDMERVDVTNYATVNGHTGTLIDITGSDYQAPDVQAREDVAHSQRFDSARAAVAHEGTNRDRDNRLTSQIQGRVESVPLPMKTANVVNDIHVIAPQKIQQKTPVALVSTQKTPELIIAPTQKTPVAVPVINEEPQLVPVAREQKTPTYSVPVAHEQAIPVARTSIQSTPIEQKIPTVHDQSIPVIHQEIPVHDKFLMEQSNATHLDGAHSGTATPHLDSGDIDRSSHLDSTVTDSDRQAAQLKAAIDHANSVHDGKSIKGDTGEQGKTGAKGDTGNTGATGATGRPGVTTIRHEQVVDTATKEQVSQNHDFINTVSNKVDSNRETLIRQNGEMIRQRGQIQHNADRISKNEQDIKDVKQSVKRLGAGSAASANLHYNRNESGYAVAVGEYEGATAVAGGMQYQVGDNSAVTVQASYDGEGVGASVGFHSNW